MKEMEEAASKGVVAKGFPELKNDVNIQDWLYLLCAEQGEKKIPLVRKYRMLRIGKKY